MTEHRSEPYGDTGASCNAHNRYQQLHYPAHVVPEPEAHDRALRQPHRCVPHRAHDTDSNENAEPPHDRDEKRRTVVPFRPRPQPRPRPADDDDDPGPQAA